MFRVMWLDSYRDGFGSLITVWKQIILFLAIK